jgi:hypothetical protein
MRNISLFFMLAIMTFGAVEGNAVRFFRAAFPSDFTYLNDSKFSRFTEQDRDSCYRHNHLAALADPHRRPD